MTRKWLTAATQYDGFPIYFRRPDIAVSKFDELRKRYPLLLIITHHLDEVDDNGIPLAGYNDSLESFDMAITDPFNDEQLGLVGLIETFAGKRTYYIYVSSLLEPKGFRENISDQFPDFHIDWK